MKEILSVILALLVLGTSVAFADIEATGEGPTRDTAVRAAMRNAVEQEYGAFIKSSTLVVDFTTADDKIFSHSRGYVTSYKILKEDTTTDGFSVKISAVVDRNALKDDLDALTILRKSVGNPRILVAFSKQGEGAKLIQNKDFVDEIYNGIVESLTDSQFRVVDKSSSDQFAQQVAETHDINVDVNKAAAAGLRYNAEYSLLYNVSGTVREGAAGKSVQLRIKTQLIDNTRSQIVTSKVIEQASSSETIANALEKAAREGGKKVVAPMIEVIKKNWMDAQQNGQLYTIVIDGVDDPGQIGKFTGMLEKFPRVNDAKEVESGGGKTTLETTYKGKRDQLDRDIVRAAEELGWTVKKVRAEGARSTWKKM